MFYQKSFFVHADELQRSFEENGVSARTSNPLRQKGIYRPIDLLMKEVNLYQVRNLRKHGRNQILNLMDSLGYEYHHSGPKF